MERGSLLVWLGAIWTTFIIVVPILFGFLSPNFFAFLIPDGAVVFFLWIFGPLAGFVIMFVGYIVEKRTQIDSAIHEFVTSTYSAEQKRERATEKIYDLYSRQPSQVMERLREILGRLQKAGTPKEAVTLETLIKRLDSPK